MLPEPVKRTARGVFEILSTYAPENRDALTIVRRESAKAPRFVQPSRTHLDNAIGWLKQAQDSTGSGGVAWGYSARRNIRTQDRVGWIAAYPETTGYIIPTMLRYADLTGDADARERARRMIEWELSIQLPDGGIQGGICGATPIASSTFVTGQVLFGLVAGYDKFHEPAVRSAAVRAGEWLISCLDDSGRFVRGHSHFCAAGAKAYEARTGAALAEAGAALDDGRFRAAASKIADFALSMQAPNGWFAQNDLDYHDQPLTHTIGYVLEGLHETGTRLGRAECIEAVHRTLRSIAKIVRDDGYLPGRLRPDWSPAVDWVCLSGSAQIAGVFLRTYLEGGDRTYFEAGRKLLGFVCFTQELGLGIRGISGGIRGSSPFGGGYLPWSVLNWATKFFADSVMDFEIAERLQRQ
jgi:hypothetical protein